MEARTALLISDPINIRYLTGFMGLAPEEREAYCLLINSQVHLFVSSLYVESASKIVNQPKQDSNTTNTTNNQIITTAFSRKKPIEKALAEILMQNDVTTLEFEKYDATVAEYEKLQKELPGVTLVPSFGRIEKMRMVKSKKEIEMIKKACALTDACFTHLLSYIKEGQTESEIAWEIETFFHKNGASSSFSPIVAFNEHSSQPHYNSLSQWAQSNQGLALKSNSLIFLDFGARVDGYCADMTRVVFLGTPKDEWVNAYKTVLKAQQEALLYLSCHSRENGNPDQKETESPIHTSPIGFAWRGESGMTTPLSGAKADEIAKKIISDAGYPVYPHGLGHGVGLAIHEAPRLSTARDELLTPGNVFSVEP